MHGRRTGIKPFQIQGVYLACGLGLAQMCAQAFIHGHACGHPGHDFQRHIVHVQLTGRGPGLLRAGGVPPGKTGFAAAPSSAASRCHLQLFCAHFLTQTAQPGLHVQAPGDLLQMDVIQTAVQLDPDILQTQVQRLVVPHALVNINPATQPTPT